MALKKTIVLSKQDARRFLVNYQGLRCKSENVLEYFDKVGCIQYDPLNVVGRNADLVLQSRIRDYNCRILDKLLYKDRMLIDGWDKVMSIYKTSDWNYFGLIRDKKKDSMKNTLSKRNSESALDFVDEIKLYIKENGPISANDINFGSSDSGSWGHKKLSSATLDYLFNIGEIGVKEKKNTQKVYDLIENLVPIAILNEKNNFACDMDFYEWQVKRRIGSVGILWDRSGGGWLGSDISKKQLEILL